MSLIGLLLGIIIICIIIWATRALLIAFSISDPIRTVIIVTVVIVCLLIILQYAGFNTGVRIS